MEEVVVLAGARTAVGTFGGSLRDVPSVDLGVLVARAALERSGVPAADLDDVLFGCCMMRSDEINPSRCISLKAGIPHEVPAATIQRQCASGMQSILFGAMEIMTGSARIVLAGGIESMSRVPYALKDYRWGGRMWNGVVTDQLTEGLTDPLLGIHMGITAENIAKKWNLSREEQDLVAYTSHRRALAAIDSGRFAEEIVAVEVPQRKGPPKRFEVDENPRRETTLEMLAKLKPAFDKQGTVTAGNASSINDAGAAVVVMARSEAERRGLPYLGRVVDHQVAAVDPAYMGTGPIPAVRKLLARRGLAMKDIDLVECNEAFAAQYLACERELGFDRERTNVNGSGIALGHPVGATGTRLVLTLLHEMKRRDVHRGLATLCVGGGMGKAILFER
ncbi:MAG: acetyl-CoA C-acetyltransferase [Deltaproteobacteria bacterium]|nr:acetyl-CoA C-acetyltransferase [Deltaproteobacteria bacterium]